MFKAHDQELSTDVKHVLQPQLGSWCCLAFSILSNSNFMSLSCCSSLSHSPFLHLPSLQLTSAYFRGKIRTPHSTAHLQDYCNHLTFSFRPVVVYLSCLRLIPPLCSGSHLRHPTQVLPSTRYLPPLLPRLLPFIFQTPLSSSHLKTEKQKLQFSLQP